jgi:acetyl-CoA C-acetyltransferase
MRDTVIISAVRTATGKFLGSLKDFTAPQLGALAVREAVRRAGIDPASVDECIMGNVVMAGEGQNPARQAALNGGLHEHVAAMTINKVCGSGLKAVMLASQGIATGDIDVAVAGGMESMSSTPYLLSRVREGLRMGNGTLVDSMIHDGLWCAFEQCHMGMAGEHVADLYKVGREDQDRYAAESHRKAARATREGWFPRRRERRSASTVMRRSARTRPSKRSPRSSRRSPKPAASLPATLPASMTAPPPSLSWPPTRRRTWV